MKAFVARLSRRVAKPETFGWATFAIAGFVYFGTTVLFDARRFGGSVWLWVLGWLLGQVVLALWVVPFKPVIRKLPDRRALRVAAVLLVGTTAGIARAVLLGIFSVQVGIAHMSQWGFRLPAGAIAGFVLTVAGAGLIGARIEHDEVVARLRHTQELLLETRSSAPDRLAEQRLKIKELAGRTLAPRIAQIEKLLSNLTRSNRQLDSIADEIREVIHREVRPMSSSLATKVRLSLEEEPRAPRAPKKSLGLPSRIDVSKAISPTVTLSIALLLCLATYSTLTGPITTAWAVAGSFAIYILLRIFTQLTRNLKPMSLIGGTLALGLTGALATLPLNLFTQLSLEPRDNLPDMLFQTTFIVSVLVIGIGYTRAIDIQRVDYELALEAFNDDLDRELSWIQLQLWVIRRDWAYLLHGKVQSALTAALARLGSEKVDEATLALVKADVERAELALKQGIGRDFDFRAALGELVHSWSGICKVEFEISEQARECVEADTGIGRSVNEILREAVGNAVRHGEAKNLWIQLDANKRSVLVRSSNDGTPVVLPLEKSLGTAMLDELTTSWSLKSSEESGLTVLEAKLPRVTSSFS